MKRRGFTLLEVLIYIALFGVLMGGAVVSTYQLLEGGQAHQARVTAQEEGGFISRKLNWALGGASSVSVSGGTMLSITRPDLGSESPLVFDGSGATMTLKRGDSGTATPLMGSGLPLGNVSFVVAPASGGKPSSVHVEFDINGAPFSFGAYLRE
jgi:prepilin-type N-terminal cleavage/methylation domain-containing protein